jgi:hypothetical protein
MADRWVLALYLLSVAAVVLQQATTHVDFNFAIFRQSFVHLLAGADLYAAYPAEQVDLFKYSPTFALLFAPFALLPTLIGLALWHLVNVIGLWYAVRRLLPSRPANLALLLMLVEVVRTTQRAQSNALVTALMVLAFVSMESRRQVRAAVAIVLGTAIKIFPLLTLAAAVVHPRRLRMALILLLVAMVALMLPLLVTSWSLLQMQYVSWQTLERLDSAARATGGGAGLYGGVMHWIRLALRVDWPNWPMQLGGGVLLLAPLARTARWPERDFRLRFLCSILIFSTIFNHQVESPSFVIAMTGIATWFVLSRRTVARVTLLTCALVVVSLGSNDLMPDVVRGALVHYKVKTLPCLAIWLMLQWELLGPRQDARLTGAGDPATQGT